MTKLDIDIIKRKIFILDNTLPFPKGSDIDTEITDEEVTYYKNIINKNLESINNYQSTIDNKTDFYVLVKDLNEKFDVLTKDIADKIHAIMIDNKQILNGDAIFIWATINTTPYMIFLKLNYQERMMHLVSSTGIIDLIKNTIILPSPQQKIDEYFFVNLENNKINLSNCNFTIYGEYTNYISKVLLLSEVSKTESETIKTINDITISTIKEFYKEEPKRILKYKNSIAETAIETGTVDINDIKDTVFSDNEIAAKSYQDKIKENGISLEPIEISIKTEKQLTRKQKIITDSGIEILIPIEYLTNPNVFEYIQEPSGKLSLIIKGINDINNK